MTYENFLKKCEEIDNSFQGQGEFQKSYRKHWRGENIANPRLIVKWSTGGVSGGSCWASSDPQPYTDNTPPKELMILDAILEDITPNLSFLQYRILTNTLIKTDSRTEYEYYGNSTDYVSKQIDVKDLYNYLKNNNLISEE